MILLAILILMVGLSVYGLLAFDGWMSWLFGFGLWFGGALLLLLLAQTALIWHISRREGRR